MLSNSPQPQVVEIHWRHVFLLINIQSESNHAIDALGEWARFIKSETGSKEAVSNKRYVRSQTDLSALSSFTFRLSSLTIPLWGLIRAASSSVPCKTTLKSHGVPELSWYVPAKSLRKWNSEELKRRRIENKRGRASSCERENLHIGKEGEGWGRCCGGWWQLQLQPLLSSASAPVLVVVTSPSSLQQPLVTSMSSRKGDGGFSHFEREEWWCNSRIEWGSSEECVVDQGNPLSRHVAVFLYPSWRRCLHCYVKSQQIFSVKKKKPNINLKMYNNDVNLE